MLKRSITAGAWSCNARTHRPNKQSYTERKSCAAHRVNYLRAQHGCAAQTRNPGGRRQVRRFVRQQRGNETHFPGFERHWLCHGRRHLPQLHPGRPMRLPAEDSSYQLLHLRLSLLCEPGLERHSPRALHPRRGSATDAWISTGAITSKGCFSVQASFAIPTTPWSRSSRLRANCGSNTSSKATST